MCLRLKKYQDINKIPGMYFLSQKNTQFFISNCESYHEITVMKNYLHLIQPAPHICKQYTFHKQLLSIWEFLKIHMYNK